MTKPYQEWTVSPHGKLTEVDQDILTVTGEIRMPLMVLPRRMTVARLHDTRLVVFSAIALDDAGMRTLEAYGRPAFLVVPSDHHRLDAKPWKDRFPCMQVVAPPGSRANVEKVVHVDTTDPHFGDPDVQFVTVAGTDGRESALLINTAKGTTLVLNDLVGNIRDSTGFGGWFLRKMRFAGDGPQIPKPVIWSMVKDKNALRLQFRQWAELESLKRILVSHGSPIEDSLRQVLRDLANSLT